MTKKSKVGLTVESLGTYLREQRVAAELSLRQLAEQAGVSNPYLSQIERGLRRPSAEVLQALATALRISAEQVYVQAGILNPDDDEVRSVELAILADPVLTERQKQALLETYKAFRAVSALAEPVVVPEVREKGLAIVTAMALPVRLKDAVVGHLYLDRETNGEQGGFDPEEAPFVARLLSLAVTAIHNAGLGAAWIEKSQELEMLNVLAQKINETLDVSEVLELDVTNADHFTQLTASLKEKAGVLHGVVHAVAYAPEDALGGKFLTTPWESVATAFRKSRGVMPSYGLPFSASRHCLRTFAGYRGVPAAEGNTSSGSTRSARDQARRRPLTLFHCGCGTSCGACGAR